MLNTTTHRVMDIETGDDFPEPHMEAYDTPSTEPGDYSWVEWACLALVIIVVCVAVFYPEVRR